MTITGSAVKKSKLDKKKLDRPAEGVVSKKLDTASSKNDVDSIFEGKKKKYCNEIDDLFAAKPKPPTTTEPKEQHKPAKQNKKHKNGASAQEDEDWMDSRGEKRKKRVTTDEGYPIYSVHEMKIGLGGDTPACPFDCDCCF